MVIMSEITNAVDNDQTLENKHVNLHASHAVSDIQSFIPGVSASILAFVVFGTTKAFRDYFYRKFVPRRIRRAISRRSQTISVIAARNVAPPKRPRPTDSTMYPPAPRRTSTSGGAPWSQSTTPSPRTECFELEGGTTGLGHDKTGEVHELAMPTPTYATFELPKQGEDEDDRWPILKAAKPQK